MTWQEPILTEKSEILRELEELGSLIDWLKESGLPHEYYSGFYRQHEAELYHIEAVEMLDRCYRM